MRKYASILSCIYCLLYSLQSNAQGCVAVRSTGGVCTMQQMTGEHAPAARWNFTANNRYFKSFRHYVGSEEQKQRVEEGSEVINHNYTLDLQLTRQLNKGWSLLVDVPVLANGRSSLYEHDRKTRYSTHAFGLGDIRFAVYKWLLKNGGKGNVQAGVGLKLPTGDYRYEDFFYRNDSTKVLGPVDQSIQLGDGGTGFTTELNTYYNISNNIGLYGNFFYLINPREQNGVSTTRGSAPTAQQVLYGRSTMSVPDQYMARAGGTFRQQRFVLSAGMRIEGIPAEDLIGGSSGFRRPGYIISAEPGVTYHTSKWMVYAFVPVALERNRTQSVPDKVQTSKTGIYTHGDAAFADYAVNVGISFQL